MHCAWWSWAEELSSSILLQVFCSVSGFTSDFLSFIVVEHIRFFHGALHLSLFITCYPWYRHNIQHSTCTLRSPCSKESTHILRKSLKLVSHAMTLLAGCQWGHLVCKNLTLKIPKSSPNRLVVHVKGNITVVVWAYYKVFELGIMLMVS